METCHSAWQNSTVTRQPHADFRRIVWFPTATEEHRCWLYCWKHVTYPACYSATLTPGGVPERKLFFGFQKSFVKVWHRKWSVAEMLNSCWVRFSVSCCCMMLEEIVNPKNLMSCHSMPRMLENCSDEKRWSGHNRELLWGCINVRDVLSEAPGCVFLLEQVLPCRETTHKHLSQF